MPELGTRVIEPTEQSDYGYKSAHESKGKPNRKEGDKLSFQEYVEILEEIEDQPHWRVRADREMAYVDGNQLDSDLLRAQQRLGIPPAIENNIGPAIRSIQGYEAATRTDFRVTPDGELGGRDVADALNFRLKQAEKQSKADAAMTLAFKPQSAVGIGWVEVSRESDPFRYPYRCRHVPRQEIHWDMRAGDDCDMRWLRRAKWFRKDLLCRMFPKHKEVLTACHLHGNGWWSYDGFSDETRFGTGMHNAMINGREFRGQADRWWNVDTKEMLLAELWYRRWVDIKVIKFSNGRVVEYDPDNLMHNVAVATGSKIEKAIVARVRQSYWVGSYCLEDRPSPYQHDMFPYVRFKGFTEEETSIPFGYVRDMIYPQDNLNSGISKLRWGMSSVRVTRTDGATEMPDSLLRQQVAMVNADIILKQEHMAKQGAMFKVERDFQLNQQHFQMLNDSRAAINRTSSLTEPFLGRGGAKSGVQEQLQVEQATQGLALIMSNFREARAQVGELLLAMILEDMGEKEEAVAIIGDAVTPDRTVILNRPEIDPDTGQPYLSNDTQRTRLKVALEEVPSSATYRGQQLNALSELGKSLPANIQEVITPYMVALMDSPYQREIVEAIRAASERMTPEQVEGHVKEKVAEALDKAGLDVKRRELELKYSPERVQADIDLLVAKAVKENVQAFYASMQAGAQVAQMPMVAPLGDKFVQAAGYRPPQPGGVDPNFPAPATAAASNIRSPYIQGQGAEIGSEQLPIMQPRENTSPMSPPVPENPTGMAGIETARPGDNLPA